MLPGPSPKGRDALQVSDARKRTGTVMLQFLPSETLHSEEDSTEPGPYPRAPRSDVEIPNHDLKEPHFVVGLSWDEEARIYAGVAPTSLSSGGREGHCRTVLGEDTRWGQGQGPELLLGEERSSLLRALLPCASLPGKRGSISETGDHLLGRHPRCCSPGGQRLAPL